MTRLFFAAALLLTSVFATAQVPNMEPPAELKKFEWMLGDWSGNVKMSMEGMELEGVMTYSMSWYGQFMKGSWVWDGMCMKMTDEGYVGWDAAKGKYSSYTFTNMSPVPRIEWGEIKGDSVIWVSEPWVTSPEAPPTISRATLTKRPGNQMKFVLEFKEGDQFTKVGEAVFKQK